MKKYLIVLVLLVCAKIALGATVCKPVSFPEKWMKFTTDIGGEGYVDYLKITAANTCGEVTAVNEYGTEFIGYRLHLGNGPWLYELHRKADCYYLDSFTFQIKACFNPGWVWHLGEFKCWNEKDGVKPTCPQCEKWCTDRQRTYITFLKRGEEPPVPTEPEYLRQYQKWQDER